MWILPTRDLPYLPVRSLYTILFHVRIYSTGMTRAISMLLHGKLIEAYGMNKLSFFVLGVTFFVLLKDIIYILKTRNVAI